MVEGLGFSRGLACDLGGGGPGLGAGAVLGLLGAVDRHVRGRAAVL